MTVFARRLKFPLVGGTFVKEYYEDLLTKNGLSDHKLVQLLNEKIRDLEKEKIKYRDQRNEWSKQNRMEARIEETLNLLEQKIEEIGGNRYSRSHLMSLISKKTMSRP